MAHAGPSTPRKKSQSQLLPPDTPQDQCFASQGDYRTGDLSLGRLAVLKDLGRYLQVPYHTLIRSAFGFPSEVLQIRQRLVEDGILNIDAGSNVLQWAGFSLRPAQSNFSESEAFQPLLHIISKIFSWAVNCQVSFIVNSSMTPFSERSNTSRPDAYIVYDSEFPMNGTHWFDIVVPFEFKKAKSRSAKYDNEQKMIWSLHHIMREDPLRRFAFGVTIEDTEMRFWYSNRAFLAVSVSIDITTAIDEVISLFHWVASTEKEQLGWDPTVKRICIEEKFQYVFEVGGRSFTTVRPLATYGADAMVSRGTRVYEARDQSGNIVAIKDSWRDESRDPEGAIQEKIFKDIRDEFGEEKAAEAMKYFVRVRACEDVRVSGERDKTINPRGEGDDNHLKWITIDVDPILSEIRHLPSTGHIPDSDRPPTERARCRVRTPDDDIPCRVHSRTVFEEVGISLMNLASLADSFTCLFGALQALYYLHKAGWVHRDFSVANVLCVEKDGHRIGKLTDFEYAKKIGSEVSHDVRTGTMHFMAVEVECQHYLFSPRAASTTARLGRSSLDTPKPSFCMNFLHDLESEWWAAIWTLFYHTDTNSPAVDPDAQLMYFNQAFPRAIAQASRRDFFTNFNILNEAYETLSTTYRDKCAPVILLAITLRESYERAEKSFPDLLLNDDLLEDVHKQVSQSHRDAVEQLQESNIELQPLWQLLEKKRHLDDSPTRAGKKARLA